MVDGLIAMVVEDGDGDPLVIYLNKNSHILPLRPERFLPISVGLEDSLFEF